MDKFKKLLFLFSFFILLNVESAERKTICLNMIVKNEKDVICRCLESVKPLIDYWVIVDTGSTDGTQEIVKNFLQEIPGELHERPWVNFSHNRNQALALAKEKGDYLLIIDADETLEFEKDFQLPELEQDSYLINMDLSGLKYANTKLIKTCCNWEWVGVVHEYLKSDAAKSKGHLTGLTNVARPDGARSKDPHKYLKDAAILEKALEDEPNNSRYVFYLAQSYRDAGELHKALLHYKKRVKMGGWDQEVFYSQYQIALLSKALDYPREEVIKQFNDAYELRLTRIEPLYYLTNYYRINEEYEKGYRAALRGLHIKETSDILFVENWMYEYGLLLEFSICAYWTGNYNEAFLASSLLLKNPSLPENVRNCVEANLGWIQSKQTALLGQ